MVKTRKLVYNSKTCEPDSLREPRFHPISLRLMDNTGEIVFLMGFYAHATVAKVKVTLLANVSNNSASDVWAVSASNMRLDTRMATSILFVMEDRRLISAWTDDVVPLVRSRVAVPFDSYLFIDIAPHVDEIYHTTSMIFPAQKIGGTTEEIKIRFSRWKWHGMYSKSSINSKTRTRFV